MIDAVADVRSASVNRLDWRAATGRPLLACYFPLGDPYFDDDIRDLYAECGVDIFELGIPSPDPYMDGPDIAGAMGRALAAATDPFDRMAELVGWMERTVDAPAGVCMAYPDIDVGRIGESTLDGLDGFLLLGRDGRDDRDGIKALSTRHGIRDCGFVPLTFTERDAAAAAQLDGYVMVQASVGVTGPRDSLDPGLGNAIAALRAADVAGPILPGFGIGTARQVRQAIDLGADGVVIGSMCVRNVLEGPDSIRTFLQTVRASLDG